MEAETTVSLNQNYSECLKAINNLGSTTYQNVCNGTETVVPWGVMDWVTMVGIATITIGVIAVIGTMIFEGRRDY